MMREMLNPCKRNVKFSQNICDVVVIVDKLQNKAKRSGWCRVVDYHTSGTYARKERKFSSSVSQVFSDKHESFTPPYVTVKPSASSSWKSRFKSKSRDWLF